MCLPGFRLLNVTGDLHALKPALSSLHSNFAPFSDLNVNLAVRAVVFAFGFVPIEVSGATVSTFHARAAERRCRHRHRADLEGVRALGEPRVTDG